MRKIVFISAMICSQILSAQDISVRLDSLRAYLFPTEKDSITIYRYLSMGNTSGQRGRIHNYPDSFLYIRKYQPHPNLVIDELRYLMHSGDTTVFNELESIYKAHMLNFEKEWFQIYNVNAYPTSIVAGQFDILVAFEQCLKALQVRKEGWDSDKICKYFFEEQLMHRGMISVHFEKRTELVNKMWYFSKKYHDLRQRFPLRSCPIYWIDPFFPSIKSCLLSRYVECDLDNPSSKNLCWILRNTSERIESEELARYFIANKEKWVSKGLQSTLFIYAGLYHYPALSQALLPDMLLPDSVLRKRYISEVPPEKLDLSIYTYRTCAIGQFCKSEQNVHLLCEELLKLDQNDLPLVKTILHEMPREETLRYMKERKKQSHDKRKIKEMLLFLEPKSVKKRNQ